MQASLSHNIHSLLWVFLPISQHLLSWVKGHRGGPKGCAMGLGAWLVLSVLAPLGLSDKGEGQVRGCWGLTKGAGALAG